MLQGIARALDLGGTFDSDDPSMTPAEADWSAIASDWCAVSADHLAALEAYKASLADERWVGWPGPRQVARSSEDTHISWLKFGTMPESRA